MVADRHKVERNHPSHISYDRPGIMEPGLTFLQEFNNFS